MKLNKLPGFAHNATRYDNCFVFSGVTDDFHEPAMILKAGENFFEIEVIPKNKSEEKTYRLRSIDSFYFMGSFLDSLSESLKS